MLRCFNQFHTNANVTLWFPPSRHEQKVEDMPSVSNLNIPLEMDQVRLKHT